jgi:DNA-binding NarL/FixJ family response regulator
MNTRGVKSNALKTVWPHHRLGSQQRNETTQGELPNREAQESEAERGSRKKRPITPSKQITVLLAEDHIVVRQGLCTLLNLDGHFVIVGQARTGREAVEMTHALKPDVILMDIAMAVLNGLEATRQIRATNPAAKVLILSAHSDDAYIERMNAAGVAGFLEKQSSSEILAQAIREVAQGKTFFSPAIAKRMHDNQGKPRNGDGRPKTNDAPLTSREVEVLQLIAEGAANKQVAAELGISIKTVEKHRQHLMDKLKIHDIAGLTRHAIAEGIIECSVQLKII